MTVKLKKPIPVILASNNLRRLWPVSDEYSSYALKAIDGNPSPLQKLLYAIKSADCYETPLIFVQENALKTAIAQINSVYPENSATIFATRPDISAGVLSTLAAIYQAQKSLGSQLVFLPSTLTGSDNKTLIRYLKLFADTAISSESADDGKICFVASRNSQLTSQLVFQLPHMPARSGLLAVDKIIEVKRDQTASNQNEDDNALYHQVRVKPTGPAFAKASVIPKLLAKHSHAVLQACSHALSTGETSGQILRPNSQFLSLAAKVSLADVIINSPDKAAVLICGNDLETVRDWSSSFATRPSSNAANVQTVGAIQCETIIYNDKILLLGEDGASDVTISPKKSFQTKPRQTWECIENRAHSGVWKIELAPGETLENECHFHRIESWTVVGGQGIAYLDDAPINIKVGSNLIISPEVCHQLHNTGTENLVVYEMRMGNMMEGDDRLRIPSKIAKTG